MKPELLVQQALKVLLVQWVLKEFKANKVRLV